jgi:putative pyoverdin transport system ATP-binding/permease protein
MKLLALLLRASRGSVLLSALCGLLSGGSSAALIALINRKLSGSGDEALLGSFIGLMVFALLTRIGSQVLLNGLQQGALYNMRLRLSRSILAAPLRRFEELGAHRMIATLTDDIVTVSNGMMLLPLIVVNAAILIGCLGWMAWLSWKLFLGMVVCLTLGMLSFNFFSGIAMKGLTEARSTQDTLFKHFRSLTEGIKELKLNGGRREVFLGEQLEGTAGSLRRMYTTSLNIYSASSSWGMFLFFVVIGLIIFAMPLFTPMTLAELTGYTLTVLYLQQPLQTLTEFVPFLARADVAMKKVEEMGLSLESAAEPPRTLAANTPPRTFRRLELVDVAHTYHRENDDSRFTLGPINLSLEPGQLLFLVGGNGSGKTTLAKLFTGLYTPESGEVRLDGQPVTDATRDAYRELFSTVFSDFHLFESLLGLAPLERSEQVAHYLKRLNLDQKVRVTDGKLSTTELSLGQRKRLALLASWLEDRPVYVFDEWAADQDPVFKQIFYEELLPEMKRAGKAVLVISHDDRYFHVADRLVRLDSGRLVDPDAEARRVAS